MIQALLFDFDGLIIDTESAIIEAWKKAYELCQIEFPEDRFNAIVGHADVPFDPWADFKDRDDLPMPVANFKKHINQSVLKEVEAKPILPGILKTIETAKALKLPLGVASNSNHDWVDSHLKRLGLFDEFDAIRCRDDVKKPKPSPDVYLSLLDFFKLEGENALAFEDSYTGLTAAKRAGLNCVAIPGPSTLSGDFSCADLKIQSLEEEPLPSLLKKLTP
ncbi:MAG: HAD-IA family hydrolase [Opitutaceae bacterium]|nr:HAD-IA family hydrolase [Opitutaceae bacterium]